MNTVVNPMTIDAGISTNPAAGVTATSPATAPVIAPSTEGFPVLIMSISTHVIIATAAAVFVVCALLLVVIG